MLLRNLGKTAVRVTEIGFGAAPLGNLFAVVTEQDAQASLKTSWDSGCRFFDTAPLYGYGLSERRVGDALREKPRDQYVLSTKVGRLLRPGMGRDSVADFKSPMPFHAEFDYSYDATMRTFEDSLQRLGLDRIDVALIHDVGRDWHGERQPEMFRKAMDGSVKALMKLKADGTIGAIGVGLNEADVCEDALNAADFDCFLLAGRYTLLEQGPLDSLFPACQKRNVSIIAGGAFNSGLLARLGAAGRDLQLWRGPAGDRQARRPRCTRSARITTCRCRPRPCSSRSAIRWWRRSFPARATPRRWRAIGSGRGMKIPAALWEDLRGRGLLHPEAPVPQGPIL